MNLNEPRLSLSSLHQHSHAPVEAVTTPFQKLNVSVTYCDWRIVLADSPPNGNNEVGQVQRV